MGMISAFHQTTVGILPENWAVKKLKDLASFRTGPFGSSLHKSDYILGGVPVINPMHLIDGKIVPSPEMSVSETLAKSLSEFRLKPGNIVIGRRGDIGRNAVVSPIEDGWLCGTGSLILLLDNETNPEFLHRVLSSDRVISAIINNSVGSTMINLNQSTLANLDIQFPPLPEQNRIAEVLSDIDAQIAALDALIAKKRDIKQGVMQELLTGRRRLPGFSGEWTTTSLGKTGDWYGGGTPSMSNMEFWTGGTIPWASSNDVRTGILTSTSSTITQAAVLESSTKLLPSGAILLVTRSGILRKYLPVALCGIPIAINQDIKAIVPYPVVTSGFLYHALVGHSEAILATCMKSGTTVESIDFNWLKAFHVPLPVEIEEQETIANVLTDMDSEIKLLQAQRNKVSDLKQAMMQELLTGRTRLI